MSTPISRAQSQLAQPMARQFRRPILYEEAEDFKRLQRLVFDYDNYIVPLFPRLYNYSPKSTKVAQLQCLPIIGNLIIFWLTSKFIYQSMKFDCLSTSTTVYMMGFSGLMFVVGFVPFLGVWATYKIKPLYTIWKMFSKDIDTKGLYHGESLAGARAEFPARHSMVSQFSSIHHTNRTTDLIEMPVMTPSVPQPAFRPGNSKASFMAAEPEQDQRASIDLSLPAYGNQPTDVKRGYGSFCPVSTNQDSGAVARDSEYYNDGVRTGKHSFESMRASTIPDEADFLKNDYMDRKSYLDNWPLKK